MNHRYRELKSLKKVEKGWINEIPNTWGYANLGYFCDFIMGQAPHSDTYNTIGKGTIFIKAGDFGEKYPIITNYTTNPLVQSKKGDILICVVGATSGKINFAIDGSISRSIAALRVKEELEMRYLYYFLDCSYKNINDLANGSAQGIINKEILKNIVIPIPNKLIQQKISDFLDKKTSEFDSIISKKEALIQKLEEAKKSLISEVVTGKVKVVKTSDGYELVERKKEEMKDSGVEWVKLIPNEWNLKRSNYVFKFSKGLSITKENLQDEGIPCINYGEIHSKYGFEVNPKKHKLKCVSKEYLKSNSNALIKYGDFIFADTSEDIKGCGNFSYLNSEDRIFAGYHTVIARTLENISSRYLAYLFDSDDWRSQIRTKVSGIKVFSITQSILKKTEVILPTLEEQKLIVDYLDNKFLSIGSPFMESVIL